MENSTPNDCIKTDVIPFIPPFSQRSSFQIINGFSIHTPSISKSPNDFGLIGSTKQRNYLRKFYGFDIQKSFFALSLRLIRFQFAFQVDPKSI